MIRYGNLMPAIADLNNLYLAFWKASRGKTKKSEVLAYQRNLYENLHNLQNQLLQEKFEVGRYHYFTIHDPKTRVICAASFPERVLHHAVMNICHPCFENYLIYDSYATRPGKGTYKALQRAFYFHKHYKYYLKLDIKKYFDHIRHEILKSLLAKRFKDKSLLRLFHAIVESYHVDQGRGVPIGNLTSQYFANHYLAGFDHWVKEKLKVKAYVRYMDDMVIWSHSKSRLREQMNAIEQYLEQELNLWLKVKIMNRNSNGLNFLSYRLFDRHIELASKSKKRFIAKYKMYIWQYRNSYWTQEQLKAHLEPLYAFTNHASAKGFRSKILQLEGA